ncbi:MAG: MFS transporter [Chloroflexi bacterium]|nr:MFS transporter [Chloroflexota bacterium]
MPLAPSLLLLIIALRILLNAGFRMVYPFLPSLQAAFGISTTTLSAILSLRSLLGLTTPLWAVAAQRSRRQGMALGLLVFALGMAAAFVWPSWKGLALALVLSAIAKLTFDPAVHAYLGDRVPFQQRGSAVAWVETAWSLSFLVGMPLIAWALGRWGWRAVFAALALLGLGGWLALQHGVPRDQVPGQEAEGSRVREVYRLWARLLRLPAAWALLLTGLAVTAANEVVLLVFGLWLEAQYHVSLVGLGGTAALIGGAELLGEMLTATVTDRLGKGRSVQWGIGLNSLAMLGLLAAHRAGSLPMALAALFAFFLTFEFTLVSGIPWASGLLSARYRAAVLGFFVAAVSLGRAVGDLVSPPLYRRGFLWVVLAGLAFNGLAWVARRYVVLAEAPDEGARPSPTET